MWGRIRRYLRACDSSTSAFRRLQLPVLETFSLLKENNPELEGDIEFVLEGDTFSARLPTDISVASLTPTFAFTGTEVSVDGTEQTSGESSQDFTHILNYTVANESGTTKTYQVDLTRFTGLPIIHLTTESPVMSKENYVNGTLRLEGGRDCDSVDEMAMEIRGRAIHRGSIIPKSPIKQSSNPNETCLTCWKIKNGSSLRSTPIKHWCVTTLLLPSVTARH